MGSVITGEGSKPEILSKIAQTAAALTRLKPVWNYRSISLSFLNTFDTVQGVQAPTRRCGHIIDWVSYRANKQLISSCSFGHTTVSSGRLPVLCHFEVARPHRQPVFREARNIKGINRGDFRKDVAALVDTQPDLTALQLNEELRSLLDKHAPARPCRAT